MRTCGTCGASLAGRQSNAKFCGDLCRAKYRKGYRPPTVDEAAESVPAGGDAEPQRLMSLDDVARELQRTLRNPNTPPTAKAPLAREYLSVLKEIQAALPPVKDEVDELLERRVKRA